ncbi:hypothetical protein BM477_00405 [Boudabousia marimammalium]|uniref:Uncharacterized protein n=1 Tax=Boudabousia marimammalium TaxID=156892 RepID=A0A1Q5PSC0_9ACTO|nr:hypothetical protein BM477_00405 [Boudabousia marimammalium]
MIVAMMSTRLSIWLKNILPAPLRNILSYIVPIIMIIVPLPAYIHFGPRFSNGTEAVKVFVCAAIFMYITSCISYAVFKNERDHLVKRVFSPFLAGIFFMLFLHERLPDFNYHNIGLLEKGAAIIIGLAIVQGVTGYIGYFSSLFSLAKSQTSPTTNDAK